MGAKPSANPPLRNPITGIADCCAPTASGHAAAPPSSDMNARRLMGAPPQAQGLWKNAAASQQKLRGDVAHGALHEPAARIEALLRDGGLARFHWLIKLT